MSPLTQMQRKALRDRLNKEGVPEAGRIVGIVDDVLTDCWTEDDLAELDANLRFYGQPPLHVAEGGPQ